jgi:enterochelin esterase-like enzyme
VSGWDVVGPVPVFGFVLLAVLAWAVVLPRRRHRALGVPPAHRRAGIALVAAVVLTTVATANAVNADFSYLPHLGDVAGLPSGSGDWRALRTSDLGAQPGPGRHPDGGVLPLHVPDAGTGVGDAPSLVWLPPQYFSQPAARFPVVYLFHGSPGVPADWLRGGQAAVTARALAQRGLPAIVVMPRMSRGWLDDPECVDGAAEKVETHFWRDVVPQVDATFRTVSSRDGRVVAGMSAGGYCALNLGLKHRDEVGTILDLSGLTLPSRAGGMRALYGERRDLDARVRQDTPARYAGELTAGPPTRVWLDTGTSDGEVRPQLAAIAPVLRARGLAVELHLRPGAHTFHVWRPALRDALSWALPAMTSPSGAAVPRAPLPAPPLEPSQVVAPAGGDGMPSWVPTTR